MTKQIIVSPNKERIQIFELIKTMIISITNIFLAFIEASPLFASATKFYYTTAIAHFLSTIATYPNLKKNYDCCSFKVLSSFYFCFRYFKGPTSDFGLCRSKQ
ncbi:hypothetical protein GLOIN_2v236328 [Rhizophagus irregularis DAOM 181602=DAOM 197198]|uniref:Uncharacterized protein n=1 Tax=Rhizophagus irregularis (strain DAOM 181602 / DAOM 197198 / MUCL 43194) TaxID=747089 RepID=A0A2P4PSJ0_RHIID|nr:hypothetical protein GLOIN_2v236328 [Rhizophagus irregularis DAOM 181602=DAOM 197198]POG68348.1 hypothetical protein GLOIN_2v236328 [Rhizophagus irregularis DAOM 181602=DAOM 197198]|eukprot:XP_025175214.1 hypothetical protein GLOIN_2v236328 [Rhizophagus irregularis DAOM 181602=DAOM 197198]